MMSSLEYLLSSLEAYWVFLGPLLAFSMWISVWKEERGRLSSSRVLSWSLFPVFSLVQFEEYAIDFQAKRYSFLNYAFESPWLQSEPVYVINPQSWFLINTMLWAMFVLSSLSLDFAGDYFPMLFAWSVATCHCTFFHAVIPLFYHPHGMFSYHPGLVTSFALLFPLSLYYLLVSAARKFGGYWTLVGVICGALSYIFGVILPLYMMSGYHFPIQYLSFGTILMIASHYYSNSVMKPLVFASGEKLA